MFATKLYPDSFSYINHSTMTSSRRGILATTKLWQTSQKSLARKQQFLFKHESNHFLRLKYFLTIIYSFRMSIVLRKMILKFIRFKWVKHTRNRMYVKGHFTLYKLKVNLVTLKNKQKAFNRRDLQDLKRETKNVITNTIIRVLERVCLLTNLRQQDTITVNVPTSTKREAIAKVMTDAKKI